MFPLGVHIVRDVSPWIVVISSLSETPLLTVGCSPTEPLRSLRQQQLGRQQHDANKLLRGRPGQRRHLHAAPAALPAPLSVW